MHKTLLELALLFLKLGTTAFGCPTAHIALMEQEVLRRRGILIAVVSLFILLCYPKVNTMWIVIGSAAVG